MTDKRWPKELKIKDLLSHEDVEPARALVLGEEVAIRLSAHRVFDPIDNDSLIRTFRNVNSQDSFNDAMNDLYDKADAWRVWIA